jgi:hypothetical protein
MPDLMWYPNCKQPVAPQKKKSNKGTIFLLLVIIGLAVFFFGGFVGWIIAIGLWTAASILLVVGLISEIAVMAQKPTCPICKVNSLLKEKPEPVEQAL